MTCRPRRSSCLTCQVVSSDNKTGPAFKWIIATGVHRSLAALEAGKGFDAYCVIKPDAYRRDMLFKQLNTLEGIGVSIGKQVRLVIDLHLKHNISLRQLAKDGT